MSEYTIIIPVFEGDSTTGVKTQSVPGKTYRRQASIRNGKTPEIR